MKRIQARHIQVDSLEHAQQVIEAWQGGKSFEELARQYSCCPTARQGGHLGEFGPGHMPPELDEVFLAGEIGALYGPIQTPHGYHLVEVLSRSETDSN